MPDTLGEGVVDGNRDPDIDDEGDRDALSHPDDDMDCDAELEDERVRQSVKVRVPV